MERKELIKLWKEKNKLSKSYVHFDNRINSTISNIEKYITNPINIEKHSFYPFIHKVIKFNKYSRKKVCKPKIRDINYSSHMDRLIYSYYAQILNDVYNDYVIKNGTNENVIAYRNNFYKKNNNIYFAKNVFDFIKEQEKCFIMVGDFSKFFDNLNHKYLKKQICEVLGVKVLSKDWYIIFKNITKYVSYDLKDISEYLHISEKKLKKKKRIFEPEEFRSFRKIKKIKQNKNDYGIPQGSAISAVLANVYMIEFDFLLKEYIKEKNGTYFRYSDDFIVIIPLGKDEEFENIEIEKVIKHIESIEKSIPNLIIQKDKTENYIYNQGKLKCYKENTGKKALLNYLGFTFDGKNIFIRDKTLTKYYYRMYKKIKCINRCNRVSKKGNVISCSVLYDKYSIKQKENSKGNFIDYVRRAEKIFGQDAKYIKKVRATHLKKIKRRLKKVKPEIIKRRVLKKQEELKKGLLQ